MAESKRTPKRVSKTLVLTPELVKKAEEKGEFYKTTTGKVKITGLPKYLSNPEHSDYIYLVNYRIVGTRPEIEKVLKNYKQENGQPLTQKEIDLAIKNYGLTKDNFNVPETEGGKQGLYKETLEHDKAEATKAKEIGIDEETINYFYENLKDNPAAVSIVGKSSTSTPKKSTTTPKKKTTTAAEKPSKKLRSPRTPLPEKLNNLKPGYVIDVSNITSTGSGAIAREESKLARNRIIVPGLAIASTSPEKYKEALDFLNLTQAQKDEYLKKFDKLFAEKGTTTTKRTKKETVTPKKSTVTPKKSTAKKAEEEELEELESSSEEEVEQPQPKQEKKIISPKKSTKVTKSKKEESSSSEELLSSEEEEEKPKTKAQSQAKASMSKFVKSKTKK